MRMYSDEVTKLEILEIDPESNRIIGNCLVQGEACGFSLPLIGNGRSSFTPKPYLHYRDEIKIQLAEKIANSFVATNRLACVSRDNRPPFLFLKKH